MKTYRFLLIAFIPITLLGSCSDSDGTRSVQRDIEEAVLIVSKSTEAQTAQLQSAFALVKQHPNSEALTELATWLDTKSNTERRAAVYILQMISWNNPSPAFEELRKLLSHEEAMTRGMAAMTLASLGDKASYANLKRILDTDPDGYVRRCAAWALGELKDERALDDLKKASADLDPSVKANALNATERLTFLKENSSISGDEKHLIDGIWLISGSTLQQTERLERAMKMIAKCPEPQRGELLKKLEASKLAAIRNSTLYAQGKL